jgi:hypothetical protein
MELVRRAPTTNWVRGTKRRSVAFVISAGFLSFILSAWWVLPFTFTQSLTNSMGYVNFATDTWHAVFSQLGWFTESGGAAGDRVVIVLAALSFLWAFYTRSRVGIFFGVMSVVALAVYRGIPQGVIWNGRVVPYWFVSIYLASAWFIGDLFVHVYERRHERRLIDWHRWQLYYEEEGLHEQLVAPPVRPHRIWSAVSIAVIAVALVVAPSSPGISNLLGITTTGNQVSYWASWNYSGYQAKPAWGEYHTLINTLQHEATTHGCGRAMWEYNSDQNRFGTPMALMILPMWTNGCIGSMEGLTFESSPMVPYHFMVQSELSKDPSRPQVGLPYGDLNVNLGIEHLQLEGVKYFVAYSHPVVSAADANPNLVHLATTPIVGDQGVRWHIYRVKYAPLVTSLAMTPNVVSGVTSRTTWLDVNSLWWITPSQWSTYIAASGPASWPHVASTAAMVHHREPYVRVSRIRNDGDRVSFHVDRLGVPVLVKIPYYPRWHASGAAGPYRVSPTYMAVVPTSHDVTLNYGSSGLSNAGGVLTLMGVLAGARALWRRRAWRRPKA